MKAIGLDIGTTTLCAAVVDLDSGDALQTFTTPNTAALPASRDWERLQDADLIADLCARLLERLLAAHSEVAAIGVTGQMHGILYVDRGGRALGPFITWQDGRGDLPGDGQQTYAQALEEATGVRAATGFGLVTLLHDAANRLVPPGARSVCTIGDYVAMRLCGNAAPRLHPSNAASLGGFDLGANAFVSTLPAGIDAALLPPVLHREAVIGQHRGIPVCCAVGDNQASAFGSLGPGVTALVNIGTGSQLSAVTEAPKCNAGSLEFRPYVNGKYLSVGAALCGGHAYHLLRAFFAHTAALLDAPAPEDLYRRMDAWAEAAWNGDRLLVDTRFRGTRREPSLRGAVRNIGAETLTPGHLCLGVLEGICGELLEFSRDLQPPLVPGGVLAAGGNGVRSSPLTRRILAEGFGMTLAVPRCREEAAIGAALLSAAVSGQCSFIEATALVRYE